MDISGNLTTPAQPAFLATPASEQANIATDSDITVVFGTEIFDQGGNFASNTFTAPVTGKYQFNARIRVDVIDTAALYYLVKIRASNRDILVDILEPDISSSDLPYHSMGGSVLVDMDASDTCYVIVEQNGGTAQSDIQSGTNTTFSGYLAC